MEIRFDNFGYEILEPSTDGQYIIKGLQFLTTNKAVSFEDALKMVLFDVSKLYWREASMNEARAKMGFQINNGLLICAGEEMSKVLNKETL